MDLSKLRRFFCGSVYLQKIHRWKHFFADCHNDNEAHKPHVNMCTGHGMELLFPHPLSLHLYVVE